MRHTVDTDVVVVGLGAMGSMTLWRLAQRGVRVAGVEQFTPGHSRGSSHGGSRIFRVAVFEGPAYVPVAQLAHRLWRELEHRSGEELLISTGALMFGSPGSELMTGSRAVAEQFDLPHELFDDVAQMRRRWPQFSFTGDDIGLFDRDAGALRPEQAIRAACREAVRMGAQIITSSAAIGIEVGGRGVHVDLGGTQIRANRAVVAAGAWTNRLLPSAGLPLEVRRAFMTWFRGAPPEDYQPGRLPVFIRESSTAAGWGIPDVDGLGFKLGHDDGSAARRLASPDHNPPHVTGEETAPMRSLCQETFPSADPRPAHVQVCMTTSTPDQGFVAGPLPQAAHVTVLAGFSGHGFKHAAGIGEIAAQLAVEGGSPYDLSPFRPDRFGAVDSAPAQQAGGAPPQATVAGRG